LEGGLTSERPHRVRYWSCRYRGRWIDWSLVPPDAYRRPVEPIPDPVGHVDFCPPILVNILPTFIPPLPMLVLPMLFPHPVNILHGK